MHVHIKLIFSDFDNKSNLWLVKKGSLLSVHICKVYCLYTYIYSIEIYVGLHFSRKFLLIRHLVNLLLPRLPRAAKRLLTSRSSSLHSPVSRTLGNFELKISLKTKALDIFKFWFSTLLFARYHNTLAWLSGNIIAGEKAAQIYWNLVSRPP